MKKIKLNIQMFASTNKTTNYELPQFIGTDKPSWLTDINSAMSTIDTGMHDNATAIDGIESTVQTASATATQASQDVATLTDTVTSQGGSITSIDGRVTSLETDNATNKANITNVTGRVSSLEADNVVNKQNITKNTNSIDGLESYFALTNNRTLTNPTIASGTVQSNQLRIALNSTGTFGKIYGSLDYTGATAQPSIKFVNTGIKGVTSEFTIQAAGVQKVATQSGINFVNIVVSPPTGNQTSASITLKMSGWGNNANVILTPSCYFFKDFGDIDNS